MEQIPFSIKEKKDSKARDAKHLVNFHFERKVEVPTQFVTPPRHNKSRWRNNSTNSKSVFFQSNFRFLLHPSISSSEASLRDCDRLVPWSHVFSVIYTQNEAQLPVCPICLEQLIVPKITKCGHSFCWTCLLQHLKSSNPTSQNCPMCSEHVSKRDLRSVFFVSTDEPIEKQPFDFRLLCIVSGTLFPSCNFLSLFDEQLQIQETNCVLNKCPKSLSIFSQKTISNAAQLLDTQSQINYNLANPLPQQSIFSKLVFTTTEFINMLLTQEKLNLLKFQYNCHQSARFAHSSLQIMQQVPSLSSANQKPQPQFSPNFSSSYRNTLKLNSSGTNTTSTAQKHDVKPHKKNDFSHTTFSVIETSFSDNILFSQLATNNTDPRTSSYDVEYLPFVTECLQMLDEYSLKEYNISLPACDTLKQQLPLLSTDISSYPFYEIPNKCSTIQDYFESDSSLNQVNKLNIRDMEYNSTEEPPQINCDQAEVNALNPRKVEKQQQTRTRHIDVELKEELIYFYESVEGEPIFLHPLCIKCLFASAYLDAIDAYHENKRKLSYASSAISISVPEVAATRYEDETMLSHIDTPLKFGIKPSSIVSLDTDPSDITKETTLLGENSSNALPKKSLTYDLSNQPTLSSERLINFMIALDSPKSRSYSLGSESSMNSIGSINSSISDQLNDNIRAFKSKSGDRSRFISQNLLQEKFTFKTIFSELKKMKIEKLKFPEYIRANVIEIEEIKLTESLKQKIPFLRHYSEGCRVKLVEITMKNIVRDEVLKRFKNEIKKRETERRNRLKSKKRDDESAKIEKIAEEDWIESVKESIQIQQAIEKSLIEELKTGPKVGTSDSVDGSDSPSHLLSRAAVGEAGVNGVDKGNLEVEERIDTTASTKSELSFKTITKMNGHFPILSSPTNNSGSGLSPLGPYMKTRPSESNKVTQLESQSSAQHQSQTAVNTLVDLSTIKSPVLNNSASSWAKRSGTQLLSSTSSIHPNNGINKILNGTPPSVNIWPSLAVSSNSDNISRQVGTSPTVTGIVASTPVSNSNRESANNREMIDNRHYCDIIGTDTTIDAQANATIYSRSTIDVGTVINHDTQICESRSALSVSVPAVSVNSTRKKKKSSGTQLLSNTSGRSYNR